MSLWWISFCDPDRPPGEQFLGVALVNAETPSAETGPSPDDPIGVAWRTGCNPGGEACMYPITDAMLAALPEDRLARLLTAPRHQLLTPEVLLAHFPEVADELKGPHVPND